MAPLLAEHLRVGAGKTLFEHARLRAARVGLRPNQPSTRRTGSRMRAARRTARCAAATRSPWRARSTRAHVAVPLRAVVGCRATA